MSARAALAMALLALLCLGGLWHPNNPDAIDLTARFAGPSAAHILGADNLGRDVFSRLLVGGWRTAAVILSVGAIGLIGGSAVGTLAAMLGGWPEALVLRAGEMFIVVPTLIVALAVSAVFGLSPITAGLALGLASLGPYTLLAHTLTKGALGQTYVHAARAVGVGGRALVMNHVLPATLPVILTYVGSQMGGSAVAYASLSFIGLGADPTKPDWGTMLFEYRLYLFDHPELVLWPGLALALTAAALNLAFDRQ
jgi:peptide/nickel transport system permease protein